MNCLDRAKYRGKRVDNGDWVYGSFLNLNGRSYIYEGDSGDLQDTDFGYAFEEVSDKTVSQFTGLIVSGDGVFEGDIGSDGHGNLFVVVWNDYQAGFYAKTIDADYSELLDLDEGEWCYKIVGNIHDNPELLESSS